jgi:hypothetical protein
MAFQLPPLNLNSTQKNDVGSGGGNPYDSMLPWNNIKNYNNHSAGATQNGSASATKAGGSDASGAGGLLGGLDVNMLLLIGAAILILKR